MINLQSVVRAIHYKRSQWTGVTTRIIHNAWEDRPGIFISTTIWRVPQGCMSSYHYNWPVHVSLIPGAGTKCDVAQGATWRLGGSIYNCTYSWPCLTTAWGVLSKSAPLTRGIVFNPSGMTTRDPWVQCYTLMSQSARIRKGNPPPPPSWKKRFSLPFQISVLQ